MSAPTALGRARRPWLRVLVTEADVAFVSGTCTLELLREVGAALPAWSRPRHAWQTSPRLAGDAMALAQHRGYAIAYESLLSAHGDRRG